MTTSTDFIVNRANLRDGAFVQTELPELGPGQVLLRVDKFALTANNITYGAAGDTIGYWKFFPAKEGWGRIPVWGFADVVKSRNDALPIGERVYGYFPMSTHLIVDAAKVTPAAFIDAAAHRSELPPVYNQYQRVSADAGYKRELESQIAIFRPLFITSFLIDDFLAENDFFGARNVVLSSASSKTALGLAQLLHGSRRGQVEVIGLTSAGNAGFVERTGYYDRVIQYADIAKLDARAPTLFVDFAGDAKLLATIHHHFSDQLKYSCSVGATHWEGMGRAHALPGAKPIFFFAPDRVRKRLADWGGAGFAARSGEGLSNFILSARAWLRVVEGRGQSAIEKVYGDLVNGKTDPAEGHILSLE
jgi:hypothetical protein